jgi:hypothetical protein
MFVYSADYTRACGHYSPAQSTRLIAAVGVEVRPGAALAVCHRLRLVVGREHVRFVLAPERLGLLGRGIEQPGALADHVR